MEDKLVVKRYADAFIELADKTIGLEKALEDCRNIKIIIRHNRDFLKFLEIPETTYSEKLEFIDKVLGEDFSREFKQFLRLMLDRKRVDKIVDIADYIRMTYSHAGETEVLLKTTFPLELEIVQEIKDRVEEKLHKKTKFYIELDGSLLGGIQLVIGNTVIDGSVRRRLDDLREKLMTMGVS